MKSWLAPYMAVLSARYRMLLQYRAAAVAGFATQLFWGAIRLMILAAFYAAATAPQPMTMPELVTYIWLGQALLGMLPWNIDGEFALQVRDGSVVYELLRPLDLYHFWFARTLAFRTAPTTLRCLPMLLFAMLVLPAVGLDAWAMRPPPSLAAGVWFGVSLAAAALLTTALTMLMHISLLWTISGQGIDRLVPSVVLLLSGMLIPLPLFPDWLQPVLNLQPFRGLVDVPFRIYSGNIPFNTAVWDVAQQLLWVVLLIWFGRSLLSRGTRTLVIQGG